MIQWSAQVGGRPGLTPGISGVYLFRDDRSPVGWFGEKYGAAIAVDTGNTKKSPDIRIADSRSVSWQVKVSLLVIVSCGKKVRKQIVCKTADVEFAISPVP